MVRRTLERPGRLLQTQRQMAPRPLAPRPSRALAGQIAREVQHLARPERKTRKTDPGLIELMGFVEHHHPGPRQEFGHAGLPDLLVGKEKVVVDHHPVGLERFAPGPVDVAVGMARAGPSQAVFAGRTDQRPQRRSFVEPG